MVKELHYVYHTALGTMFDIICIKQYGCVALVYVTITYYERYSSGISYKTVKCKFITEIHIGTATNQVKICVI